MAVARITHAKVSVVDPIPAPTDIVTPSDWNSDHSITGGTDAQLMVVNGVTPGFVTMSGDGTINNAGALSLNSIIATARTYYVRTDGSNSNNGLSNTAAGAFLTIQKAFDTLAPLNVSAGVTIQVGNGTYTGDTIISAGWSGGGVVILQGDIFTPSNVFLHATNPIYILDAPVTVYIQGFRIVATGGNLLSSQGAGSYIVVNGKMQYGSTPGAQEFATRGGRIRVSADIDVEAGAADSFAVSSHGGNIRHDTGVTTFLGNFAYSTVTGFVYVDYGDIVWTGTASINVNGKTITGQKFGLSHLGMIQAAGLFPPAQTFFPGSLQGVYLDAPVWGFSANKGAADQTGVASAAFTQVTFPTETYDVGGYFTANAWTPPPGQVTMQAAFYSTGTITASSLVVVAIYKNGAALAQSRVSSLANEGSALIAVDDRANGADVYSVFAYVTTSVGTATISGLAETTFFKGHWISP